jgi:hypothetical protein
VANRRQESGQEPFTEREQEIIKELAREVVTEAGINGDSQAETAMDHLRDHLKAYADLQKHIGTLSAVAAAAVVALYENFDWGLGMTGLTLVLLGLTFFWALLSATNATSGMGDASPETVHKADMELAVSYFLLATSAFGALLTPLLMYLNNLPES